MKNDLNFGEVFLCSKHLCIVGRIRFTFVGTDAKFQQLLIFNWIFLVSKELAAGWIPKTNYVNFANQVILQFFAFSSFFQIKQFCISSLLIFFSSFPNTLIMWNVMIYLYISQTKSWTMCLFYQHLECIGILNQLVMHRIDSVIYSYLNSLLVARPSP